MAEVDDLKRKIKDMEAEIKIEPWVLTFGDLMSLLMCFFVLLISFSTIVESQFFQAVGSLQGALSIFESKPKVVYFDHKPLPRDLIQQFERTPPRVGSPVESMEMEVSDKSQTPQETQNWDSVEKDVRKMLSEHKGVSVQKSSKGLSIIMESPVLFDTAKDELKDEAESLLKSLGNIALAVPNMIALEGHTDSDPINTDEFPSNWELSNARALSVLKHLVEQHNVDPTRVSATGFGEFRPIDTNESKAGKARNRRVEMILLRKRSFLEEKHLGSRG